jgi:hypothetical protein
MRLSTILTIIIGGMLSNNVYAATDAAAMIDQINGFIAEGYHYVPPTPEQKRNGVIGTYHKAAPGSKAGGFKILDPAKDKIPLVALAPLSSTGGVSVPDVSGRANKETAVHSYHRAQLVNQSGKYVCIPLVANLTCARGVTHDEIYHACMNPGAVYDSTSDVWMNVQYGKGNHGIVGTLTIQDYPVGTYQGFGTAHIN